MATTTALPEGSASVQAPAKSSSYALTLTLFCLGHLFVDLYSSALGIMQPMLLKKYGFTFTMAGLLGGTLVFASSVMQPVYGYLSDRLHSRMFTVLAPGIAGIFISSVGLAPAFPFVFLMVFIGGSAIASFHPQAASLATAGVAANRGRAMAIFISSGTVGFAMGPTFFSTLVDRFGLDSSWYGAVPGVLMTLLLLVFLKPLPAAAKKREKADWSVLRAVWKPMLVLYLLVVFRSIVQVTYNQFLPLYLNVERGMTLTHASYVASLYSLGGALGGFAGGNLSDRFGGRFVILFSMIASVPFLGAFLFLKGIASLVCLIIGGLILLFTIPVNIVMGQQLAPGQTGTVSALMMGFAWGVAGLIFIPLTGWMSDHFSLQFALAALLVFPVIGFFLARTLPK